MLRRAAVVALTVGIVALGGCGSQAASPSPSGSPADPTGSWQLVTGELDGAPIDVLETHPITLVVDGSEVGGTAACNAYGGRISITGAGIAIGELMSTDMACMPEDAMASEAAYLAALARVTELAADGERLMLLGPAVRLAFEPLPEPPTAELVGQEWTLETLFVGDIASSVADTSTLTLHADGSLEGFTGCRSFTGRWVERGNQIHAVELAMGDEPCDDALVEQDGHVVSVIGDGFVPSIEGRLLTLLDPGGVGLVYRAPG